VTKTPRTPDLPVRFEDVQAAASLLAGQVHRTPVATSRQLNERAGASLYLKCENLQRTGAFKIRGALNALSRLSEEERARGVLTYSSGNHAQAVALAGQLTHTKTTVIMPDVAPVIKRRATEGYGAHVIAYDPSAYSREDLARERAAETGETIIPPYDHPHIVAGQGTAGLELFEEVGALDMLFVCCGGGGLLSGCALAARRLAPRCHVVGVEPEAGDDATRSFYSGTLQTVQNPDTIADGARTPYLGEITFPLVKACVDDMITVPDADLIRAMHFVWERMKLVVEPTGALALAGALSGQIDIGGKRAGILVSGGNVDLAFAAELFATL